MLSSRAARILKALIGVLALAFVVFVVAGLYLYGLYQDLPDLEFESGSVEAPSTSVVYAADGSVIAEWHGEQDRTFVPLDDLPVSLTNAVLAVEDERFYSHHGVDFAAILRAFTSDREPSDEVQGGSTITQQLVKLLSGGGERTLVRKVQEALLAYQLEARTEKDRVLEAYLNVVYLGHGWYGVEAAAQNYFGKPAAQLDTAEAATLAAIIRSPGRYSPKIDPEEAVARRNLVLSKMEDLGSLGVEEAAEARAQELSLAPPRDVPEIAPHFVEYVKQQLIDELGVEAVFQGGLRVHTTLDPRLQAEAEGAAHAILPSLEDPEVAVVCIDHRTGHVRGMVGGRDFAANQFNLAAQGHRQPGSAFKPFVLVAALEQGVSPSKTYSTAPYEVPVEDGVWRVENYDGAFPNGTLTLRDATAFSVNAVYARLIVEIGAESVVEAAEAMGIETPLEANPAIALGGLTTGVSPLEMASAFGTIASGGIRTPPIFVTGVEDADGETVYQPGGESARAISEGSAVEASKMLHDVVERGTGVAARIQEWSAGKTGTTQSYRDAWFVGYSGDLVTAVWVGYPEAQVDMTNVRGVRVTGGSFPARIWARFMARVVGTPATPQPAEEAPEPEAEAGAERDESGTVLCRVCTETFDLANERCPDVEELYLLPGQVPDEVCDVH